MLKKEIREIITDIVQRHLAELGISDENKFIGRTHNGKSWRVVLNELCGPLIDDLTDVFEKLK